MERVLLSTLSNYPGATKSGLDIGMGAVGLVGPIGLTISGGYFIVDLTIGWDNAIEAGSRIIEQNQSIHGMGWNAFRMEGGLK